MNCSFSPFPQRDLDEPQKKINKNCFKVQVCIWGTLRTIRLWWRLCKTVILRWTLQIVVQRKNWKMIKKNSGNPPACACWRTPWSFLWRAWSPFHLRCRPGKGRGRILFAGRVTKPTLKETLVWITCYSSFLHSYQSFLTLTNTGQGASREGSSSCRSWSQHNKPSQRKHRSSLTYTFDCSRAPRVLFKLVFLDYVPNIPNIFAFCSMSLFQGCTVQLRATKWRWSNCWLRLEQM